MEVLPLEHKQFIKGLNEIVSKCNAFAIGDCSDAIHMKNSYGYQGMYVASSFQGNLTSYLR
ncbi:hypothetical protein PVAP13_7KG294800 [Panicum virgatum]|uniref:Uncharacterized protein n=1 Tax=Panicum virgatum TaxID=38727 RepID=A0A8T0QLZ7_PANVG|nr:hypothetical protein PVAP13_7KG294800 [Panicum virgatum]